MNMHDLSRAAHLIWGLDSSAFHAVDAVLVTMVVEHVLLMDAQMTWTRANLVAVKAIVELSTTNPMLAREYMAELAA